MITRKAWATKTFAERLNLLQSFEVKEATLQGREPALIKHMNDKSEKLGRYDEEINYIYINRELFDEEIPDECLHTYFHEERHAQQYNEGETFDNYINYDKDQEAYFNQDVEVDAENYADRRMQEFEEQETESKRSQILQTYSESEDYDYSNDYGMGM